MERERAPGLEVPIFFKTRLLPNGLHFNRVIALSGIISNERAKDRRDMNGHQQEICSEGEL